MMNHAMDVFVHHQANPVDLSRYMPGKALHVKAIADGLRHIRLDIRYTVHALQYYFSGSAHAYDQHTVSRSLASATVLLEGLLDGLVICSLPEDVPATRGMSFQKTKLVWQDGLRDIQERVLSLNSHSSRNKATYADFWTIADFWKHYLPCIPLPVEFPDGRLDFQVELGRGGKSGPILKDLIFPTFHAACDMLEIIGEAIECDPGDFNVERLE